MINKRIVLLEKKDICHTDSEYVILSNDDMMAKAKVMTTADVVGVEMEDGIRLIKSRNIEPNLLFKCRASFYKEAMEKC